MNERKKAADEHELAKASAASFFAARSQLDHALGYFGETNNDDLPRLRLALSGIASACDALKGVTNAYSNVLAHISRGGS